MADHIKIAGLLLFALVCYVLYFPGLTGPFILDDFHNLAPLGYGAGVTDIPSAKAFIFSAEGLTGRPVSMASFLLDDNTWPSGSFRFKHTNLLFHIATGLAIFLLIREMLHSYCRFESNKAISWAILTTGLWLMHPLLVSTTLYAIQRMAILAALFSILAIWVYLKGRLAFRDKAYAKSSLLILASAFFMVLGFLSKENAALCLMFIFFFEMTVLPGTLWQRPRITKSMVLSAVVLVIALVGFFTYDFWVSAYEARAFTLAERLAVQPAILGDYLLKFWFPTVARMNIFDGRFEPHQLSVANIHVWAGYLIFLSAVATLVYGVFRKEQLLVLGFTWFFVFHFMESSFLPLELYFEHRNYLPSVGLLLCFIWFAEKCRAVVRDKRAFFTLGLVCFLYLGFCTQILTKTWGDTTSFFVKMEGDAQESVRAKILMGTHLDSIGLPEFAPEYFEEALQIDPRQSTAILWLVYIRCKNGDQAQYNYAPMLKNSIFDFGNLYVFNELAKMQLSGKNCFSATDIDFQDLAWLIPASSGFGVNPVAEAAFWDSVSNYYAALGDFPKTMEYVDRAILATPSIDLYIKKAVLLTSGGLYAEALEAARFAARYHQEHYRSFFADRSEEIGFIISSLENQIGSTDEEGP